MPSPASPRLYRRLLAVYPAAFRARAGGELCAMFNDAYRDARRRGWHGLLGLWARTALDLLLSAAAERWRGNPAPRPPPHQRFNRDATTMDTLLQDLRYALRSLRTNPGATVVVVATLAIGIGVNTALFSLVDQLLLRPLPIAEPERVVAVYTSDSSSGPYGGSSVPDFQDFRDRGRTLDALAAVYQGFPLDLSGEETAERIAGAVVSADYFTLLGVDAARGRLLGAGDLEPGAPTAVVLGHRLWQRRFGGRSEVIGEAVVLNGSPATVVGVAPAGFAGTRLGAGPDVWLPLSRADLVFGGYGARLLEARGGRWLNLVGRLAEGVDPAQAQAELQGIMASLAAAHPDTNLGILQAPDAPRPITVEPIAVSTLGGGRRPEAVNRARLLMAIVGLVLLTACANVANLVLARTHARRRELAVRLALGAPRRRLIRQLLTESLLLGLAGGAAGLAVAWLTGRVLLPRGLTAAIAGNLEVATLQLDVRVLAFAVGASLLTAATVGLWPALRASRPDLVPALRSRAGRLAHAAGRGVAARDLLVIAQVAGSIVLLIGAGLFVRSLLRASSVELGFQPDGVVLASVDPGNQGLDEDAQRAFYDALLPRVASLPGVEAAALASRIPVMAGGTRSTVEVEGYQPAPGEDMEIDLNVITPDYFRVLAMPLLRGRPFDHRDGAGAPLVVIVNQAFAQRFWPGQDPIGKRLLGAGEADTVVVGMVATAKYRTIREDPRPHLYYPLAQASEPTMTLALRARGPRPALIEGIRQAVRALRPAMPLYGVRTLRAHQGEALARERTTAVLVAALGLLTLLIAAVGVYGVTANAVAQQRREIGIRSALGAGAGDLFAMVVRRALVLAGAGIVLGGVAAGAGGRFVAGHLYGVGARDPLTFLAGGAVLVLAALGASAVPAWRAARTDPTVVMRDA